MSNASMNSGLTSISVHAGGGSAGGSKKWDILRKNVLRKNSEKSSTKTQKKRERSSNLCFVVEGIEFMEASSNASSSTERKRLDLEAGSKEVRLSVCLFFLYPASASDSLSLYPSFHHTRSAITG